MGLFDFLKSSNKKDGDQDNSLTIKELYYQGKSHWLNGELDEAVEFFKKGINEQDRSNPYSYACLAMYYYEIAPKESEHQEATEYNKVVSWGGAYVRESAEPDLLVLYCLGDTAAKLGTVKESASSLNPFYEALYRYLGMSLYSHITENYQELSEKINKYQETPIFKKQGSLMREERDRTKRILSDSQKEELNKLTEGKLKTGGLLQRLMLDIHDYPENEFYQMQKGVNKSNILISLILFCSLISEARLEGLEGLE